MKQRLFEGDKHGAVSAVLVDHLPGDRTARVSFWLRAKGQRVDFECSSTEAEPLAKRLVTPVRDDVPEADAADAAALLVVRLLHGYVRNPCKDAMDQSASWDKCLSALAEIERLAPQLFEVMQPAAGEVPR